MLYENNILIEGHLTKTPELKETKSGKNYCHFGVCYNDTKKLSSPNEKGYMYDFIPNFFNLSAWGKTAENAVKLAKGDPVSVTGKLCHSTWTDDEGNKKDNIYILVRSIKKISKEEMARKASEDTERNRKNLDEIEAEDEIPF